MLNAAYTKLKNNKGMKALLIDGYVTTGKEHQRLKEFRKAKRMAQNALRIDKQSSKAKSLERAVQAALEREKGK